jgi:hypothetical protein
MEPLNSVNSTTSPPPLAIDLQVHKQIDKRTGYKALVLGIELQCIIQHCIIRVLYCMKCSIGQIACIELCIELRICRIILIINNQRSTALRSHFQCTTMEINGQRRIGQWSRGFCPSRGARGPTGSIPSIL